MSTISKGRDPVGVTPVFIRLTLREHLTKLEANENEKPPAERYHVPTLPELSEVAGISRQGIYKLANGKTGAVSFTILAAIISELRRLGFPTEVSDLLIAYPANSITNK